MVDDDVLLGLYKLLRKRSIDDSGPVLIGYILSICNTVSLVNG